MIHIIINADDLGHDPVINGKIRSAIEGGKISSSTIMANSKYLDEVHKIVDSCGEKASFGVHLNLTEGPSLTNPQVFRDRGITDENGCFIHGNSKRCRYPDSILQQAIYEEWDAQITKLEGENFHLSHADGHHHCQSWPGLEEILVRVLKKHNIRKVRNCYQYPYKGVANRLLNSSCKLLYLLGIKRIKSTLPVASVVASRLHFLHFNRLLNRWGIISPDYFGAYETFCSLTDQGRMKGFTGKDVSLEMMCHPGIKEYEAELQQIYRDEYGILPSEEKEMITYKQFEK